MLTRKFIRKFRLILVVIVVALSLTSLKPVENVKADTCVSTPDIHVRLDTNEITADCFLAGSTVLLAIDDPSTLTSPDYEASGAVPATGFPTVSFTLGQSFALKPGFVVQASDNTTTKQLTLWELSIDEININEVILSGKGKPSTDIQLAAHLPSGETISRTGPVNSSGNWIIHRDEWGVNISFINGIRFEVSQRDDDYDRISFGKAILPPIAVNATGRFYSDNWGRATVTFSVDDPLTVQNPDCSESVYLEWGGMALNEDCLAKVGDIITVTGDGVSTVYMVPLLDVTKIDVANSIIEGIADPNQHIIMQADYDNYTKHVDADTNSDANGHWIFDFASLTPPVDLRTGLWGIVKIVDEAGNYTFHLIDVTVPHIYVFLNTSTIYGWDFLPLEMITLKVDDPNTPQNPDYETTAKNPRVDWNPDLAHPVEFALDQSFPLKPGYVVEVSDSAFTRQITLWNLSITSVDLAKDTVSGISSRLGVDANYGVEVYEKPQDNYLYLGVWRYSYFDDQGNWSVDFANPNADPDERGRTLDVKPGTRLWVLQYENYGEDFDAVALDWTIPLQTFPNTPILDNFNRANGGLGLNWKGAKTAYQIIGNRADVRGDGAIYWKTPFGVDQEAYITINTVDPAGIEQDLLLKVQGKYGPNWGEGVIEVLYNTPKGTVGVETFRLDTLKWYKYPTIPVTFANGDQFGAQALSTGDVVIFKNGVEVGRTTLTPADQKFFNSRGGSIGLWFIRARNAFFDDFGGGNIPAP